MRSAVQRIAAYDARMQSSQIDPVLTAVNAQQMANHAAHVGIFYPKQVLLRDFLNLNGFTGPVAFKYEALNGEMYHASISFAGPALIAEGVILKSKYLALGLVALDISAMQLAVWNIIVP
jgi:hypothetical protein